MAISHVPQTSRSRFSRPAIGAKRRHDPSWFAHPEMVERIAEAEEDERRGQFTIVSAEGVQAHLDDLKSR